MYRVSDRDRERGLALLRRCYEEGRLTVEELADRAERLAGARTTAELRAGLRGLPHGLSIGSVTPRLQALRQTPAGEEIAYRIARTRFAGSLFIVWLCTSVALYAALAITKAFTGPSDLTTAFFLLGWVAMTWVAWRLWRRGARPG